MNSTLNSEASCDILCKNKKNENNHYIVLTAIVYRAKQARKKNRK